MNVLYVINNSRVSPSGPAGGSLVYYQHLRALCSLGHEVSLLHYSYGEAAADIETWLAGNDIEWLELRQHLRNVEFLRLDLRASLLARVSNRLAGAITGNHVNNPAARDMVLPAIAKKVRELAIDVLWAGHYGPLQLCLAVPGVPVLYTLHDWMHSIGAMKSHAGIVDLKTKSEEFAYIAKAAGVACVSSADIPRVAEISSAVVRHVALVPAFKVTSDDVALSPRARIVHLGNLKTTATRLGLLRFFDVVWPLLGASQNDVDVIGGGAGDEIRDVLSRARYHGFVENLGDLLRFGDIHVIPWEHATGVRTRISLALCFGQVIVAVRSGVAGSPELENGYNCILVDKLEEMADAILRLSDNIEERTRLGRAARLTAERLQSSNTADAAINDLLAGASCKKH